MEKYYYDAKVTEVYDGDTITVDLDLGFYTHLHNQKFRLLYVDAPEIRGETRTIGLISRDRLRELILDKNVVLHTFKDSKDKFGRWLCEIFVDTESGTLNVNEYLVSEGYAAMYSPDLKFKK